MLTNNEPSAYQRIVAEDFRKKAIGLPDNIKWELAAILFGSCLEFQRFKTPDEFLEKLNNVFTEYNIPNNPNLLLSKK